ncbi:hypothetical protein [Leisingera sp. D0M16]
MAELPLAAILLLQNSSAVLTSVQGLGNPGLPAACLPVRFAGI